MLFSIALFLLGCILITVAFFFLSDSTLNLFLCEKFGASEGPYVTGKVIWIIGASSGIGEALALRIARHRCSLILSARREDKLQTVKQSCISIGVLREQDIGVLPIDITEFDTHQEKVQLANAFFDRHVDTIVLCCGQSQRAEWTEVDPSVDEQCFRVNALGPTVLARASVQYSFSRGLKTHFVVISSVCGIIPAPLSPSYTAAKHALMGYFRLLTLEYGYKGIDVTIVCPSLTYAPNNVLNAFTDRSGTVNGEVLEAKISKHMSAERAAQLILIAAANRLCEASLSQTALPLLMAYFFTFSPDFTQRLIRAIGPDRLRAVRTGTK